MTAVSLYFIFDLDDRVMEADPKLRQKYRRAVAAQTETQAQGTSSLDDTNDRQPVGGFREPHCAWALVKELAINSGYIAQHGSLWWYVESISSTRTQVPLGLIGIVPDRLEAWKKDGFVIGGDGLHYRLR